ncbi:hypothetical protein FACS189487_02910 [Campylobacterota bacterium]|nr:hypothetical protein FACS189487_02910 [Campylobacterota bacterium]
MWRFWYDWHYFNFVSDRKDIEMTFVSSAALATGVVFALMLFVLFQTMYDNKREPKHGIG